METPNPLNDYDLQTIHDSYVVMTDEHPLGTFRAVCMWDQFSGDLIQIEQVGRVSAVSEQDALDQICAWAEEKFGPCKIAKRNTLAKRNRWRKITKNSARTQALALIAIVSIYAALQPAFAQQTSCQYVRYGMTTPPVLECNTTPSYTSPPPRGQIPQANSTGIDFGAFNRGVRQGQDDYYRQQQLQGELIRSQIQNQQNYQTYVQQQYEANANAYLSSLERNRLKGLAAGLTEEQFFAQQWQQVLADPTFRSQPQAVQNLIAVKFSQAREWHLHNK